MTEPNESDRKATSEFMDEQWPLKMPILAEKLAQFRAQAREEERERCASLVEDGHGNIGRMLAAEIRGGPQVHKAPPERDRVIEECAKVAEEHLDHMDFEKTPEDWQQHHEYPFRCNVAEAIRALKEKK